MYQTNHLSCYFTNASGRLSPFKPCVRCCHESLITAASTPLSPSLVDPGRQGREVEPLWRAGPITLPAGREHGRSLWLLTPRSSSHDGQGRTALSITPSDFGRSVMWPPLTAEFPSLGLLSINATAFTACSRPCRERTASAVEGFFIRVAMLLPSGYLISPLQRYFMHFLRPRYSCSTCGNRPLRSESVFSQLQHVTFRLPTAVHDLSGQYENQFPDGWSKAPKPKGKVKSKITCYAR